MCRSGWNAEQELRIHLSLILLVINILTSSARKAVLVSAASRGEHLSCLLLGDWAPLWWLVFQVWAWKFPKFSQNSWEKHSWIFSGYSWLGYLLIRCYSPTPSTIQVWGWACCCRWDVRGQERGCSSPAPAATARAEQCSKSPGQNLCCQTNKFFYCCSIFLLGNWVKIY